MEQVEIPNLDISKVYDAHDDGSDFHIERLDNLALFFGRNMPTHYHDRYYQLHVILEGTTHVLLDQAHYSETGTTLFFTPPAVPHSFITDDYTNGYVVTASQPLVWRLLDMEIGRNDVASTALKPFCTHLENPSKLVSLLEVLLSEQDNTEFMSDVATQALLQLVLIDVMRHANTQPASTIFRSANVAIFNRFNQIIEANYKQHLTLPEYADKLGLTTARLNNICRKISGLSSKRLVAERVIQEARRLLLTPMPVSQVAYELGYQDPAYFARFFKKQVGETASEFRLKKKEIAAK